MTRAWPWGRRAALAALLVGLAAGCAPPGTTTSTTGAPPAGAPPAGQAAAFVPGTGPQGAVPQFTVECGWSHAADDDPIVHRGHHGVSHRHDFFGNTTTDADSTPRSLRAGDTTCQDRADTAAYWTPALLDAGVPVQPLHSVAYYRPGPGVDPTTVRPYPPGLMVVAGDPGATEGQDPAVAAWSCGSSPVLTPEPRPCADTAPLGVRIVFPDCWDGEHADSVDHRRHLARSADGRCPRSHPVPVPQLIFQVQYPVTGAVADLELASGGRLGVHADFLNAWDQDALEREVRVCLNGGKVCGVVSGRATG